VDAVHRRTVGGASGYQEFLGALSDPHHEEHEHMKAWVGRPFDSRAFSLAQVNERLRKKAVACKKAIEVEFVVVASIPS
jgi:hypothetical protein